MLVILAKHTHISTFKIWVSLSTATESKGYYFRLIGAGCLCELDLLKSSPPPQPQDFWWITVGRGLGSSNCWPNNLLDEVHEMICLSVSQQLWLYHHYSPLLCLYLTFLWLYLIRNNSDSPAAPSPRLSPQSYKHQQLLSDNPKNLQTLTLRWWSVTVAGLSLI